MCDHQHGFALGKLRKCSLHSGFIVRVGKSGGLVKQQDGRIFQHGAGNGNALLLAAGQIHALGANDGMDARRKFLHNIHALCSFQRCQYLSLGGLRSAQPDVVQNAALEQAAVLEHKGDGVHQLFLGDIPHIRSAHPDAAALHIKESADKVCQRGFSTAGGSDEGHRLPRPDVQRNTLDNVRFAIVTEMHIVQGYRRILRMLRMAEKMRQYGNALEAMSNEAVEYVRGIPVVKTFGQSVFSFKKFKATIDEYEKWVISYTKDLRLPMMFYTAAVNGVFAFLIAGGLLFTAHGVTTEFLLNLLFYIIITPVISLTLTRIMYMSENKMVVADALARIDSVLEAAPMPAQAVPQHPQDASVALQNVHFSYDGKNEVIKGVSLEIQPGQTVAFVGPSGGGKSTLANLVCRFFDVQSGSVRVGGADVRAIPKEERMDTISFVFQNSRLLKGSILDNVRLGRPQATEVEVLAALKAAQCMDIIEKFPAGIHTVIGTKGVYLSGGEQQRIAIARAMLKNAPILIMDEATAFADPDNEAKVQAAFAQLAKGKTVLMIAHRLSTVANADCIYVVQDGQIAESGTKDELCAQNGLFARMWQEYQASVQWKVAKEGKE